MFFQAFVTLCLAFTGVRATPRLGSRQVTGDNPYLTIPPSKTLVWHECFGDNFFCALLDVPLDYALPTGSRAHIAFVKYAATATPYLGALLTNFGGPGDVGVDEIVATAVSGTAIIGSSYDFIGFDPRGIGYSAPVANCSASAPTLKAPATRRYVDKLLLGPRFSLKFFTEDYQSQQVLGKQCQAAIGGASNIGPYMHSAVVAQDMISFLDAYANSSYSNGAPNSTHLNYWGFSYGTYIGQVFANLYPSRVGRMVLDAVVDAATNRAGGPLGITYSDEAFSTFFVYCSLAGPSGCSFATGKTSNDVLARFEAIVNKLTPTIASLKGWSNATVIELTLEAFKYYSYTATYTPVSSFPGLSDFFVYVETLLRAPLTMTGYENLINEFQITFGSDVDYTMPAIQCTDNDGVNYGRSLTSFLPKILAEELQSFILGEYTATGIIECAGWSIRGKGVYLGPFGGVTTANPILFVSNTRDPVTPLQNGQKATSIYPGSKLLTVDGTGHTSLNTYNGCAYEALAAYFINGTLPGPSESFCPLDASTAYATPFGVSPPPASALKKRVLDNIQSRLRNLNQAQS